MVFYMANMLDIFHCRLDTKRKLKSLVDKVYVTCYILFQTMFCCTLKDNSSTYRILCGQDLSSNA